MCSTPKGQGGRPRQSSAVHGLINDMSAAEYSGMVQRANDSYERRQKELAKIRSARKLNGEMKPSVNNATNKKAAQNNSFIDWMKNRLMPLVRPS